MVYVSQPCRSNGFFFWLHCNSSVNKSFTFKKWFKAFKHYPIQKLLEKLNYFFYMLLQKGINLCSNEVNHRLFMVITFFHRACLPSCPNALIGWTCTTALPTLERWPGRRQAPRGRIFSTSSMNSWVSGPEQWITWNIHIFCQRCQLLTLGRHAILIFPLCLHPPPLRYLSHWFPLLLHSYLLHNLPPLYSSCPCATSGDHSWWQPLHWRSFVTSVTGERRERNKDRMILLQSALPSI